MVEVDLGKVRPEETNVQELIDQSFLENMNGAKIMQDAEGKWGLLTPGADTVFPFFSGGGGAGKMEVVACLNNSSSSASAIIRANNITPKNYKNILLQTVRKLRKTWSQGLGYGIIKSTKPQWRTQAWGTFKERIGIR